MGATQKSNHKGTKYTKRSTERGLECTRLPAVFFVLFVPSWLIGFCLSGVPGTKQEVRD
jgi:hypothetical protein